MDELDIHWYLYIILVLGICGGLKVRRITRWRINENSLYTASDIGEQINEI